jgi:hypothetical protein
LKTDDFQIERELLSEKFIQSYENQTGLFNKPDKNASDKFLTSIGYNPEEEKWACKACILKFALENLTTKGSDY